MIKLGEIHENIRLDEYLFISQREIFKTPDRTFVLVLSTKLRDEVFIIRFSFRRGTFSLMSEILDNTAREV